MASLVLVGLLASCSSSESSGDTTASAVQPVPAECSGHDRTSTGNLRERQWRAAVEQLTETTDESVEVWVGFSNVVTAQEAADWLGSLEVTGLFLAYEEQQGTYAKVYVGPDRPEATSSVEELAAQAVSGMRSRSRDEATATALEPVDSEVRAGEAPVVGIRVKGSGTEIAGTISAAPCGVYSLAPGDAQGPELTTAVEP
jgi:hypothetical protein